MVGVAGIVARVAWGELHRRAAGNLVAQRGLVHRPHVHCDVPIGLDDPFPNGREDDLPVGANEVIVTLLDVGPDRIDVEECLLDEIFHSLRVETLLLAHIHTTKPTSTASQVTE